MTDKKAVPNTNNNNGVSGNNPPSNNNNSSSSNPNVNSNNNNNNNNSNNNNSNNNSNNSNNNNNNNNGNRTLGGGTKNSEAEPKLAQIIAKNKQEAREKAEEIEQKVENEFQKDKLNRIRVLSLTIRDDIERKKKDKVVAKRIEHSRRITEARTKKMRERDLVIKKLKEEVLVKLIDVAKSPKYPDLIKFLIVQGLMTITENRVIAQCRKEDLKIVQAQVDPAVKQYQEIIKKETGIMPKCVLEINTQEHLPPAPTGKPGYSCCGGVVLSARGGTIICRNTLDSRLDLCFDNLIPQVRGILFGVREAPKVAVPQQSSHH